MLVFLDFEASSLAKTSYPIEVAWVFEDGAHESHLIRPAPDWTDWAGEAEAIHHISRAMLERDGIPHEQVAHRMVAALTGHDLLASAPSWDGKWLSVLLRAAGLPRHALRLRDSDAVPVEAATTAYRGVVLDAELAARVEGVLKQFGKHMPGRPAAHRALPDARADRARWIAVRDWATEDAIRLRQSR